MISMKNCGADTYGERIAVVSLRHVELDEVGLECSVYDPVG